MMKMFLVGAIAFLFLLSAFSSKTDRSNDRLLALGQMPNLASDRFKILHLVYGNGDSIFYSHSAGNGSNFAKPVLVAVLPHLAASHTRGPQIAVGDNGLLITACTNEGNIFSYKIIIMNVPNVSFDLVIARAKIGGKIPKRAFLF